MKPEIIYLAKDRYTQAHTHYDQAVQKAARIITLIALIIGLLTIVVALFTDSIFSPQGLLDWTVLICQIGSLFSLICAWGHALLAIKFGSLHPPKLSKHEFDHLQEASREAMDRHILNCYVEPTEELAAINTQKEKYLTFSYQELAIGGYLLAVMFMLLFLKEVL